MLVARKGADATASASQLAAFASIARSSCVPMPWPVHPGLTYRFISHDPSREAKPMIHCRRPRRARHRVPGEDGVAHPRRVAGLGVRIAHSSGSIARRDATVHRRRRVRLRREGLRSEPCGCGPGPSWSSEKIARCLAADVPRAGSGAARSRAGASLARGLRIERGLQIATRVARRRP